MAPLAPVATPMDLGEKKRKWELWSQAEKRLLPKLK